MRFFSSALHEDFFKAKARRWGTWSLFHALIGRTEMSMTPTIYMCGHLSAITAIVECWTTNISTSNTIDLHHRFWNSLCKKRKSNQNLQLQHRLGTKSSRLNSNWPDLELIFSIIISVSQITFSGHCESYLWSLCFQVINRASKEWLTLEEK